MASIPALGDNFNDPQSDDTASAPAMPQPPMANNPLAQILKNKGKKKNPRNPASLASAISRAKRGRQFGDKWG